MIGISNVSFAYPGQKPALSNLTFHGEEGRTIGLVGANGSGKSTLLTLLAGLFTPSAGTIQIGPYSSPGQEKKIRALTGLVLQEADLQILGLTVGEDLGLALANTNSEADAKCREMARRFSLDHLWDQPVETLSWGQKRRLCLAAVLVKQPTVLLLDEPFIGLDYYGVAEMRTALLNNKKLGLTQIIATHNLEPVADLVDQWMVLYQGEMTLTGDSGTVFGRLKEFAVKPPCSCSGGYAV
ncbi:MAG: ABC transporter ATP-binding protein [Deltaproteobacteria bacterium]|nr:ABC transporter ATP-binding protein [Deltaproteobacteria bacterium]